MAKAKKKMMSGGKGSKPGDGKKSPLMHTHKKEFYSGKKRTKKGK